MHFLSFLVKNSYFLRFLCIFCAKFAPFLSLGSMRVSDPLKWVVWLKWGRFVCCGEFSLPRWFFVFGGFSGKVAQSLSR